MRMFDKVQEYKEYLDKLTEDEVKEEVSNSGLKYKCCQRIRENE